MLLVALGVHRHLASVQRRHVKSRRISLSEGRSNPMQLSQLSDIRHFCCVSFITLHISLSGVAAAPLDMAMTSMKRSLSIVTPASAGLSSSLPRAAFFSYYLVTEYGGSDGLLEDCSGSGQTVRENQLPYTATKKRGASVQRTTIRSVRYISCEYSLVSLLTGFHFPISSLHAQPSAHIPDLVHFPSPIRR